MTPDQVACLIRSARADIALAQDTGALARRYVPEATALRRDLAAAVAVVVGRGPTILECAADALEGGSGSCLQWHVGHGHEGVLHALDLLVQIHRESPLPVVGEFLRRERAAGAPI